MCIGEVLSEVLRQLREAPFPLDLASLVCVEQGVAANLGATHDHPFAELGQGSFLQFVLDHVELREEVGESIFMGMSEATLTGRGGGCSVTSRALASKKKREKVLAILAQLSKDVRKSEVCIYVCCLYVYVWGAICTKSDI